MYGALKNDDKFAVEKGILVQHNSTSLPIAKQAFIKV